MKIYFGERMQKFIKYISIQLLNLSLIFSVMSPALPTTAYSQESCSYPKDVAMDKKQRDCATAKSREWICRLNRCVTTAEATLEREKFKDCAEKIDPADRKTCHDKYASEETGVSARDAGSSGDKNLATLGTIAQTIYAGMAINAIWGAKPSPANLCTSRKVYMGGAVIMLLTEVYMRMTAKKKFKAIAKKYNSEQADEDAFQAQLNALEYLKEEQKEVASLAKTRKNAYTLQMIAFTASLGLAVYELIEASTTAGMGSPCALANVAGTAEITSEDGTITPGVPSKSSMLLLNSKQVAWSAGVSGAWSLILRGMAAKQEKEATSNAGEVDKTIAKFKETMAGSGYCTPTARNDLANPQCYCYEKDGDKNMDRTNSDKCQALWAQSDQNLMVSAAKYEGKLDPKMKVCMLVNGQVDKKCQCRQMLNKTTGENACLKVPMGTNSLSSLGTALGVPGISSAVGNLANGNTSLGSLSSASLENQLAKTRKALAAVVKKANDDRGQNGLPPLNLDTKKREKIDLRRISPKQIAAAASASLGSLSSDGRPSSGALAGSLAAAEKSSGISRKALLSGGSGLRSAGSSRKSGDNFAFLNSASGGAGKVMGGAPKKNYDYKDNDIVKNKGVSIWKVISSRYTKSAMRRLFGDNK
jgi:hypothetical protein